LTNHGRALLCIAHDPGVRLRDIAATLHISERSAYAVVADLTAAGYVLKTREGRRNRYAIQHRRRLPEPSLRDRTVGEVLELLTLEKPHTQSAPTESPARAKRSAPRKT
jgi:hypothetical protein